MFTARVKQKTRHACACLVGREAVSFTNLRAHKVHDVSARRLCSHRSSRLHIILALLFVELALLFSRSILVLLILGNQIVHVRLGLSELHLIHSLPCVPMEECLTAKHRGEVLCDPPM